MAKKKSHLKILNIPITMVSSIMKLEPSNLNGYLATIVFLFSFPIISDCPVCFQFYHIEYRFNTKSYKGYVAIPPVWEFSDNYLRDPPPLSDNGKSILGVIKSLKEVEICNQIQKVKIYDAAPSYGYICKKGYRKIPSQKFIYASILNKESLTETEGSFLKQSSKGLKGFDTKRHAK